jgi:hypothetical protein
MGSNDCCLTFILPKYFNQKSLSKASFMARILNDTTLDGDDFITFYSGDFNRNTATLIVSQHEM